MTLDEAIARITMLTRLEAADVRDLLAAANEPRALELLIRSYTDAGKVPDLTGWQIAGAVLGEVEGVAAKVAPILDVAIAVTTLAGRA